VISKIDIKVLADLPVGRNLMDHIAAGNILFSVNVTTTNLWKALTIKNLYQFVSSHDGVIAEPGGAVEAIAFFDTTRPEDLNGAAIYKCCHLRSPSSGKQFGLFI
jgi:hypothetical protein